MFKFGTKTGVLGIVAVVLAIIPILTVLVFLPQLGDTVPMRFDAAGEVTRWASKYELFIAPTLSLALVLGTVFSAFQQSAKFDAKDPMAGITFARYIRNGVIVGVIMNVASAYILFTAVSGHGFAIG